ncbi:unnamed protein product [Cochlearia groenlandica]
MMYLNPMIYMAEKKSVGSVLAAAEKKIDGFVVAKAEKKNNTKCVSVAVAAEKRVDAIENNLVAEVRNELNFPSKEEL